jgi:hypothetical protein
MAISRTNEWRQFSPDQRHINATEVFGRHSRNPSGLAIMMAALKRRTNDCIRPAAKFLQYRS